MGFPNSEECGVCDSTGLLLGDTCPLCDGDVRTVRVEVEKPGPRLPHASLELSMDLQRECQYVKDGFFQRLGHPRYILSPMVY